METLKKIVFLTFLALSLSIVLVSGQNARQAALHRSYEYEKSGNYSAAVKEINAVYKADDYFVNIRMGWLLYLTKQYAESIKFYEKAITLKPYAIEAKFGSIKPLSATENWDKVKSQYIQILKIDPQNTVASYWLGVIYYNRKDYLNAAKLFEKVVNLYPLDYDSVIMLAWTKLYLGKTAEAKLMFNHALALKANDSSALSGLKLIK